ncbi:hypothetical protein ACIGZJ_31365 [Kitasatospora sp. NPDC052868]|uniref:hypothetical protein n=1 Tax=Kitasatospora sp. NPDC052868 TaxID=3364060 RepID=UPI0037C8AF68
MLITKPQGLPGTTPPAVTPLAAALPLAVGLPALTAVFADRLGTPATAALAAVDLALIAAVGALAARANAGAERARRDEAVLDALLPLPATAVAADGVRR